MSELKKNIEVKIKEAESLAERLKPLQAEYERLLHEIRALMDADAKVSEDWMRPKEKE